MIIENLKYENNIMKYILCSVLFELIMPKIIKVDMYFILETKD